NTGAGREATADEGSGALPRHRLEDELVICLVEQEDRRRLRAEDCARHLDDRLKQCPVLLLRAEHACGNSCAKLLAHASPPTLVAVRYSTLFSWNGVSSRCLLSTSAARPEMCGVAKLLPVQTKVAPPSH